MKFILFCILLLHGSTLYCVGRGGPVVCGYVAEGYPPTLATEHFYDSDGDGVPEFNSRIWICGGDDYGFYISIEQTNNPAPERSYDCDPGNLGRGLQMQKSFTVKFRFTEYRLSQTTDFYAK